MSIRVMSEVWAIELPDSQKIVLLALADCANDEGVCWPSVATLAKKCSKSERTIQIVIRQLYERGHLTRVERLGKGCLYTVHPCSICTPAAVDTKPAPPQPLRPAVAAPPQPATLTPAATAPKPSRTIIIPQETRARKMPDDWKPAAFGVGTQSRAIVDGWSSDDLTEQIEHFTANHRAKGSKFENWQSAWSTWVLNSQRFGGRRNDRSNANRNGSGANPDRRSGLAIAIGDGIAHIDAELARVRGAA